MAVMQLQVKQLAIAALTTAIAGFSAASAEALPPAADVPEEVLRTQIILDARSPIDGKPMTPAEYATFQAKEQTPYQPAAKLAPKLKETVGLLKLRKFIKTYLPFVPLK